MSFAAFATGFFGQANANMAYQRQVEDEWSMRYADRFMQGQAMFAKAKAQRQQELSRIDALTARTGDRDLAIYIVKNGIKDENIIDRLMIDKVTRKPVNGFPEVEQANADQGAAIASSQPRQPMQSGVMQDQSQSQPQKRTFGMMLGLNRGDPAQNGMQKAAAQMGVDPAQMQAVTGGDYESMLPQYPEMSPDARISLAPKPSAALEKMNEQLAMAGLEPGSAEAIKAARIQLGLEPRAIHKKNTGSGGGYGYGINSKDQLMRYMAAAGIEPGTPEFQAVLRRKLMGEEEKGPAEPETIRLMRAAGIDPNSEEGREILKSKLKVPGEVQLDANGYVVDPKMETSLRKEINSNPTLKAYATVRPMLNAMQHAEQVKTKAADLDLIYAIAKIYDPESVVRESELQLAQSTGTIGDKLKSLYAQVVAGNSAMMDSTRAALVAQARNRYQSLETEAKAIQDNYRHVIKSYRLDPNKVLMTNTDDIEAPKVKVPMTASGLRQAQEAADEGEEVETPEPEPAVTEDEEEDVVPAAAATELPDEAETEAPQGGMTADEFLAIPEDQREEALEGLSPDELERLADELEKRGGE